MSFFLIPSLSRSWPENQAASLSCRCPSYLQAAEPPRIGLIAFLVLAFPFSNAFAAEQPVKAEYAPVGAIFTEHCLDCHASKDPEGELVLESFDSLMKGGELGPALVAGKSGDSLLVRMIEGHFEKDGKKLIMPPGKRQKLSSAEIAAVRAWIDAGAPAPTGPAAPKELVFPKIIPNGAPRNPINAVAYSPATKLLAVGRYGEVELRSPADLTLLRELPGQRGNVNALVFSANGEQLFAAGGQPGVSGEVRRWSVAEARQIALFEGHQDAIYSLALSPDGKMLATGGYDQKIKLWDVETGKEIKTLSGHNGCVYHLAFRPDGNILASASADRTVKLWDVASGERRDTLSQSLKELYTVAFSPDGKWLAAGGADNRLRVWEISPTAAETANPMLHSIFAHEGAILNLVFSEDGKALLSSADDRTVKLWNTDEMKERLVLEKQPDWPPALAFVGGPRVVVGRSDGSFALYDSTSGKIIYSVEGVTQSPKTSQDKAGEIKLAVASPTAVARRDGK
jgi:WD40 repeat protein